MQTLETPLPEKKASRFYRPELDVLRCCAFLMVLTHHVVPQDLHPSRFYWIFTIEEAGAAGVCLFFLLSAYLITELMLREREATGTLHIPSFYVRRVLRIWPLYFLILALGALVPLLIHRYHDPLIFLTANLLLVGNWPIALMGHFPHNNVWAPLWSISVEEQFYLLWPALMLFCGRRGVLIASLLLLPLAWATDWILPCLHVSREPGIWCNSLSQFQFFALGGLLALLLHKKQLRIPRAARLLMCAAGLFFLGLSAYPFHYLNGDTVLPHGQVFGGYLCIDAGVVLLLLSFLQAKLPGKAKPLIYLGKISYGLYVFHFPIRLAVGALLVKLHLSTVAFTTLLWILTMAPTTGIAILSYEYFEKPFLKFKRRFTFIPSRAA